MLRFILIIMSYILCTQSVLYAQSQNVEYALDNAAKRWNVPKGLLEIIAEVESSYNPLVINIEGMDYTPKTLHEAIYTANLAYSMGKSFDIGLMQINVFWINRFRLPIDCLFDPNINAHIGAWILSQEFNRYGKNWKAIGAYHCPISKNKKRSYRYAEKIIMLWKNRIEDKQ